MKTTSAKSKTTHCSIGKTQKNLEPKSWTKRVRPDTADETLTLSYHYVSHQKVSPTRVPTFLVIDGNDPDGPSSGRDPHFPAPQHHALLVTKKLIDPLMQDRALNSLGIERLELIDEVLLVFDLSLHLSVSLGSEVEIERVDGHVGQFHLVPFFDGRLELGEELQKLIFGFESCNGKVTARTTPRRLRDHHRICGNGRDGHE